MKKSEVVFILIGVGWYVALSLLVPFGIGFWLDRKKFHSFPLLSLVGLGIGSVIMVFGVYKMLQKVQGGEKNKDGKNK